MERPYTALPSTLGLLRSARAPPPRARYGGRYTVAMLTGDGVSPEMMEHVKSVYYALEAPVDFDEVAIDNNSSEEVVREAVLAVRRNGVALKGSLKTIPGEGEEKEKAFIQRLLIVLLFFLLFKKPVASFTVEPLVYGF